MGQAVIPEETPYIARNLDNLLQDTFYTADRKPITYAHVPSYLTVSYQTHALLKF